MDPPKPSEDYIREWWEKIRKKSAAAPACYYPQLYEQVWYPDDLFKEKQTLTRLLDALDLSSKIGKEVAILGAIINNRYVIEEPEIGEDDHVSMTRKRMPTEDNPFHPYQAYVFVFHTHSGLLLPAPADLHGYIITAGDIRISIEHKKSQVTPKFTIGRKVGDTQEFLSYSFIKERFPTPSNRMELDDAVAAIYNEIDPFLKPYEQMSEEKALVLSFDYCNDLMRSLPGITVNGFRRQKGVA